MGDKMVSDSQSNRVHPANPGYGYPYSYRSLEDVSKDSAYEYVASYVGDNHSYSQPYVYRHKATGTLWAAIFEHACQWWEVEEKIETIQRVTYVSKKKEAG